MSWDMRWYVLDGRTPRRVGSLYEWARWMETAHRHVAVDWVGNVRVSTVFLGLDHQHGNGPPLLFETMIFAGEHDQYQDRCSTWEEAELMHAEALQLAHSGRDVYKLFGLKEGLKP
jgi:hypothetical protein